MATIVDAQDFVKKAIPFEENEAEETTEEFATLEEAPAEATAEAPVEAEVEAPSDEDLPDKYKGKSASDIARMHQELEKRLGQQSSEVGELRRHFDEYVQSNVQAQQSAPEVVEEVDFFADPNAAMAKAIENHPTLKQAQAVAAEMAKSQALAKLKASHPDMSDVLQDEGFRDWVSGSPIRRELYQKADAQYDFAAADELITLYKERQGVVKQTAKVEKQHQKNEVKRASTGTARSNPEGATSKKIYRRRDIIELMNSDPKRYEALLPEIMKAYAEKRVK
jgi:hypothetical protein